MQTAKEIMTSNVVTIKSSATVAEAVKLMRAKKLRNLIVEPDEPGDSVGILTEADVVYKVAANGDRPESVVVASVMTKPCIEVDPDMSVQEVAGLFANYNINRAPVVKGELLGVISAFDIVRETMWWQG